jgi:hypothetical protein
MTATMIDVLDVRPPAALAGPGCATDNTSMTRVMILAINYIDSNILAGLETAHVFKLRVCDD